VWSFWLKNQNSAKFAPLFCALGRRTRPQKWGQQGLTGDRRLVSAPMAAELGRRNTTEIPLFWSLSATNSAAPKRRLRAPFWSQRRLTKIGAPVLRPRPPNRAPFWPDGAKKYYAIFMAFHAMVNQKGMQEEILNEQLCTQHIQTHQYKNKSLSMWCECVLLISSKQT
jgi:hypothetical protein